MLIYVVKRPQGKYGDYKEIIDKIFLNKELAEKYTEEENNKLPLEQLDICNKCIWQYVIRNQDTEYMPECFTGYKYGCCENYLKYNDTIPLFIEEYKIDD